jgi:hypothetical protein
MALGRIFFTAIIIFFFEIRTLSPMNSFSSELGLQFGSTLEAPHVIDVESQV